MKTQPNTKFKRILSILLAFSLFFTALPLTGLFDAGQAFASNAVDLTSQLGLQEFGDKKYRLYRGIQFMDSSQKSGDTYVPFYYSDGFFEGSPTVYNEHLATTSLNFAIAAMHFFSKDHYWQDTSLRHTTAKEFLTDIGCPASTIYVNDESLVDPTTESIAFTFGYKKLQHVTGDAEKLSAGEGVDEYTGYILLPIGIRGSGYESEWFNNFLIGSSGEALGFSMSAKKCYQELMDYIESYNLLSYALNGKIKFWVSGYSRAGGVANILSKMLVDQFGTETVYGFSFEAPMGGVESEEKPGVDYSGIYNLINYYDIVPMVAPAAMGFKRYGTDVQYIPAIDSAYQSRKPAAMAQLAAIDPAYEFEDEFKYGRIDTGFASLIVDLIKDTLILDKAVPAQYNGYSAIYTYGQFEKFFCDCLTNWGLKSRTNYADTVFKLEYTTRILWWEEDHSYIYDTLQDAISTLVGLFMTLPGSQIDTFMDILGNNFDVEGLAAVELPFKVIHIKNWNSEDNETKKDCIDFFWDLVEETKAFEAFDKSTYDLLKKYWPTVANALCCFLCEDMHNTPQDYGFDMQDSSSNLVLTASLINNGSYIKQSHDYIPNIAWIRTYDSYYENELNRITKDDFEVGQIGIPYAYVCRPGSTEASADAVQISNNIDAPTVVQYGDEIILDVPELSYESLYYSVENTGRRYEIPAEGAMPAGYNLYQGGFKLPFARSETIFKINVYAAVGGQPQTGTYTYYMCVAPSCRLEMTPTLTGLNYNLYCNYDLSNTARLMTAVYDNTGKMINCIMGDTTNISNKISSGTVDLNYNPMYTYKMFLVDSDTMVPLT